MKTVNETLSEFFIKRVTWHFYSSCLFGQE